MNSLGSVNRRIVSGAFSLRSCGYRRGSGSNRVLGQQQRFRRSHAICEGRSRGVVGAEGSSSLWQNEYHVRPTQRFNIYCWQFQLHGLGEGNDDRQSKLEGCKQSQQNELYIGNSSGYPQFSRGGQSFANFHIPPMQRRKRSDHPVRFFSSSTSNRYMNSFFNHFNVRIAPKCCIDKDQFQYRTNSIGGKAKYHTKRQHQPPQHQDQVQQPPQPPSITKMLSILLPESNTLLLAFGALTISTAATMQIPNAIGQIIDILSTSTTVMIPVEDATSASNCMMDAGNGLNSLHPSSPTPAHSSLASSEVIPTIDDGTISMTPQQLKEQVLQGEMESIGLQLMTYFTVGAMATFAHSTLFDTVGQKISADLRKKLFGTLIHRDLSFFDQNKAGELANRLSTDVHEVAEHLVQNFAYYLSNLVRSLTAIVQMILISPLLTATMVPLPILIGGLASFYGKFIRPCSAQHLDVLAHSTHMASERFLGMSTVLSFGQRRTEQDRYSGVIDAAYGYARRVAVFQGAFNGSSYLVGNGALLAVLIVGAAQVCEGNMTAGSLVGFCLYAGHLSESVIELSTATGGILQAQGSGARLFALLEKGGEPSFLDTDGTKVKTSRTPAATLPATYNPTIRFEDVEFAYPAHPHTPILNNLSFTLRYGEMLALTGLSGSGKSSIVSLLMRFYEPNSGRISLDGVDIRHLDVNWLRSQIGLVGQEPILFHASVFDNVAYGKPHSTKDEVIEACIAASAHRFILELPDQYDTIVGSRGASISG